MGPIVAAGGGEVSGDTGDGGQREQPAGSKGITWRCDAVLYQCRNELENPGIVLRQSPGGVGAPSAGPQDAPDLGDRSSLVGHEHQPEPRQNAVHTVVRQVDL